MLLTPGMVANLEDYFNKKNNYINKNILLSKVKENNPIIVKQLLDLFNKSKNTNFSCYFAFASIQSNGNENTV